MSVDVQIEGAAEKGDERELNQVAQQVAAGGTPRACAYGGGPNCKPCAALAKLNASPENAAKYHPAPAPARPDWHRHIGKVVTAVRRGGDPIRGKLRTGNGGPRLAVVEDERGYGYFVDPASILPVAEPPTPTHGDPVVLRDTAFCGRCGERDFEPGGACVPRPDAREHIELDVGILTQFANGARAARLAYEAEKARRARRRKEGARQLVSEAVRGVVGGWNRRP